MDSFGDKDTLGMTTKIDAASSLSSRQKSCNACVRGKRRCDKRTPRCTRCAAKGLECVYHKMPPAHDGSGAAASRRQQSLQSQQPASGQSTGGSSSPEMADLPDFDMGFDYESLGTETSPESMCQMPDQPPQQHHHHRHQQQTQQTQQTAQFSLGPGLDFDIVDFMNAVPSTQPCTLSPSSAHGLGATANNGFFASLFDNASSKMDIPPVPSFFSNNALVPPPPPPQQQQQQQQAAAKAPIRDLSLLRKDCACPVMDPLEVHDRRSWMGYTVNAIKGMHRRFAQTRALPFIHPRLWAAQLPRPILAVFSAATAYTHRGPDNEAWIMKLLADTAVAVHRDGEAACASPHDKLARLQALLVLDSVRVFDGDLGLRAAAEREAPVMTAWIAELQQTVVALEAEAVEHAQGLSVPSGSAIDGPESAAAAYPSRDRPPKSWDAWILLESARRTLLYACAFVCMTKLLKSMDVSEPMWDALTFTASRHLWEAPSSLEFFRSWRDKPQYYIRDFDFKDFWSYARPDDMDEFTKMMLMPQIGFDALEHFMAEEHPSPVAPVG